MTRLLPRLAGMALLCSPLTALPQVASDPSLAFDKLEAMVPMRDGVKLETVAYLPRGVTERLPVLFMRTPYGFDADAKGYSTWLSRPWLSDLLRDGYLLVLQNVRGRFRSEGVFELERAPRDRSDPRSVDEGTDAYDTVEWLLGHVPCSGKVGMLGVSNPARLVAMAMLEHHPAVKAYSPQATPADNYLGDDYFHGGVFRAGAIMGFVHAMESGKEYDDFQFDRLDLYQWFLDLGPLANVDARFFHGAKEAWNGVMAHPTYDAYWKGHALPPRFERVPAPVLHVGGAYDQEDRRGPVALYQAMERHDTEGRNFLVVGPWAHRTWRLHDGDRLGAIPFGSATGKFFREEVQAPFFACALKGRCGAPLPEALVFQTGSNVWQRLDAWPPRGTRERSLYLGPGGRLGFTPPAEDGDDAADAFLSDPAHPVPYQPRPIPAESLDAAGSAAAWPIWMVGDQRFAEGRPDVLTWTSQPLAEEVVVSGQITADLFVSVTGSDADFVAKLIDVLPEKVEGAPGLGGYELPVAAEILRARYRHGFERPEPLTPGTVEELRIDLLTRNHAFKKGHRIQLQVQSSWFPLYERNPQTWVADVFQARASDFRAQTHRVHRSRRHPSRVIIEAPRG